MAGSEWESLRGQPLAERTTHYLTERLLSGELAVGDYLPPEHELCEQLGIGRSTLREAVSVLEARGLLRRRHGVGVQVIDRSQQAASAMLDLALRRGQASDRELLEMRRLYEVQAAGWAAERRAAADLAALRAALDQMRQATTDRDAYAAADLAFHLAVARSADNRVLAIMVDAVRGPLAEAIAASLAVCFEPETTLVYHAAILEAIAAGDAAASRRAMACHLDHTATRLLAAAAEGARCHD